VALYETGGPQHARIWLTAGRQQRQPSGPGLDVTWASTSRAVKTFRALQPDQLPAVAACLEHTMHGRSLVSGGSVARIMRAAGIAGGAAGITGNFSAEEPSETSKCSAGRLASPCRASRTHTKVPAPGSGRRPYGAETCAAALNRGLCRLAD